MLVILGSGHAGYTLAREWRKRDATTPLTILTRDDGASYYKPDLSKAFAAGKDAAALVKADAAAMAAELGADIRTGVAVDRIDTVEHAVYAGGERFGYDKLVLALGAAPIRLGLAGDAAGEVLSVNDRLDYARLRERLAPGCNVVILGAGLIGCEFANDFAATGFRVALADLAAWPLARFVPEVMGRALESTLANLGVRFYAGAAAAAVNRRGDALEVVFADGRALPADVVVSAVGLRPNLDLARAAGLRCGAGIHVDAHLRTSAPDVYALGDCVEIGGRPMPFILPIGHAARALAPTLAGSPTEAVFPAMPTPVKTPALPIVVCPAPASDGAWQITGAAPDLEAVYVDAAGLPAGFALSGKATARRGVLAAQIPSPVLRPA